MMATVRHVTSGSGLFVVPRHSDIQKKLNKFASPKDDNFKMEKESFSNVLCRGQAKVWTRVETSWKPRRSCGVFVAYRRRGSENDPWKWGFLQRQCEGILQRALSSRDSDQYQWMTTDVRVRDGLNIFTKIPKRADVNFSLKFEIYLSSRSRNIYSYRKESPYLNEVCHYNPPHVMTYVDISPRHNSGP